MTRYEAAVVTCFTGELLGSLEDAKVLADFLMDKKVPVYDYGVDEELLKTLQDHWDSLTVK
jgi:hypothetical protein